MKNRKLILILIMLLLIGCVQEENNPTKKELDSDSSSEMNLEDKMKSLEEQISNLSKLNKEMQLKISYLIDNNISLTSTVELQQSAIDDLMSSLRRITKESIFMTSLATELPGYQEVYGYIQQLDFDNNILEIDTCELLFTNDKIRLKELGLDLTNDFPKGYYIYNEDFNVTTYQLSDATNYIMYLMTDTIIEGVVDNNEFSESVPNEDRFYRLRIYNGVVIEAGEYYLP